VAIVNFYNKTPQAEQIASDLNNDELVVFNAMRTGARILADEVELQVDFGFNTHNESTIPPWNADDYDLQRIWILRSS
jgi:hypothetical protein